MIEGQFVTFPIDRKSANQVTEGNVLLRKNKEDSDLFTGMIVRIVPLDSGRSITRKLKLANTGLKSDEIGLHTESKRRMYGNLPRPDEVLHLLIKPANLIHRITFYATHSGLPNWVNNLIAIAGIVGIVLGFAKWALGMF